MKIAAVRGAVDATLPYRDEADKGAGDGALYRLQAQEIDAALAALRDRTAGGSR